MDCEPSEDPLECFNRLEDSHDIDTYFFIVPWNSKMHGTEWEGGMLARDFKYGRYPAINLFLDTTFSSIDDDGAKIPQFQEGQRTRYLNSLVNLSHSVRWWRDYENLADQVAMTARAIFEDFLAE